MNVSEYTTGSGERIEMDAEHPTQSDLDRLHAYNRLEHHFTKRLENWFNSWFRLRQD